SGSIKLKGVRGGVEAGTGSGDVEVDGDPKGAWDVHTGSGTVELRIPSQASFDINADSSSGEVSIDHPVTIQAKIKRNHREGKVGSGGALLTLRTGSGDIRIR